MGRPDDTVLWEPKPVGRQLTVSDLRAVLAGLPDGMAVVIAQQGGGQEVDPETIYVYRGRLRIESSY